MPVFAATGVSEERVKAFVTTLSKTYAGGKVIFELVPMVLLSPHEATLLKRVVSEQIPTHEYESKVLARAFADITGTFVFSIEYLFIFTASVSVLFSPDVLPD